MGAVMNAATERPKRPIVWGNVLFLVLTPLAAAIAVPWYVVTHGVGWVEIAACVGTWLAIGLGVTAGYHRLFSHRAWDAPAPVRLVLALLGAASFENSVISWSAAHRYHHRFVDTDDDPYNPQRGFWYSHMGWVMEEGAKHGDTANVPDLWKDSICSWQHRHYLLISVGVNAAMVLALGWLTGNWLGMLIIGFLLRLVLTHHFTFLINSAAHMWGSQPWSTSHSARDSWLLSFFTFGEGYHNYHHTFQSDYRNGVTWYNWDPTKWLIWVLSRIGLAQKLRRSPVDVTLKKLYDQARTTFEEQLASASETLEALRARGRKAGDDARALLAERLVAAEAACDEALAELTRVRQGFQTAVSADGRRRSVRQLKRQLREARRSAETALEQWRELGEAYVSAYA